MACLFFSDFSLRLVYRSQPFVKVFKCNSKATCWYCDSYWGSLEHLDRFREKLLLYMRVLFSVNSYRCLYGVEENTDPIKPF